MTEIPDMQLNLPRPLARGASRCHVLAIRQDTGTMVAACGISCGGFCGEASYDGSQTHCSEHGDELCAECVEVIGKYERTGDWEGVESDPFHGYRRAGCYAGRCPNTVVIVNNCWCYEHLGVCQEYDCEHPAHECEEEIHFCPEHGGHEPALPDD